MTITDQIVAHIADIYNLPVAKVWELAGPAGAHVPLHRLLTACALANHRS